MGTGSFSSNTVVFKFLFYLLKQKSKNYLIKFTKSERKKNLSQVMSLCNIYIFLFYLYVFHLYIL